MKNMLELYEEFCKALKRTPFTGEIKTDFATRLSVATDNSIYQVIPRAVIFPKNMQDICIALKLGELDKFQSITFSPRGGGTATNGQSLSPGIIIDCSKHMRNILEVNLEENWVRVQPGVVLDQLNSYLKKYNRYFVPEISPSNRATLGGMINTDACGNGSKIIGRTSDHVLDLTAVLANGNVLQTSLISNQHEFNKELTQLISAKKAEIKARFVERPRNLNGYNLLKAYSDRLNLNYLLCGSEGTLAVICEAKLKIFPIPKVKKLILVKYKSFEDALLAHDLLEIAKPLVVEAIDEKLLDLARQDAIYFKLQPMLDGDASDRGSIKPAAINLVEFVGDNEEEINQQIQTFCELDKRAIGYYIAKDASEIKLLWELRKKSVGLISKKQVGTRRPIPFIEDTAVPPEKLANYISEFKKILDHYQLTYGMYGHVDAGCVHVRPALDLKQTEDEKLFRELSDKIVALVEKFGGVMWGEHGMGFRCHYAEQFFGKELYYLVRQIKTFFDPHNRLNPGKIASPLNVENELVEIDGPLRAKFDKQISVEIQQAFPAVMACNGNGACFNYATQDAMCPSYKVTKDRVHSPKGRAVLMREWLRINKKSKQIEKELYGALNGCLSCKACAGQCPLSVDVPEFKSKFLSLYHQKHFRPLRDYLIASLEFFAPLQLRYKKISNWLLQTKFLKFTFRKIFKMVDIPVVNAAKFIQERLPTVSAMTDQEKEKAVFLLQDAFTSFYEVNLVEKTQQLLTKMGLKVYTLPFSPSGKPLHIKGFLKRFEKVAKKNIEYLRSIAKYNIPIIGIEPSVTLTYRDEYKKLLGGEKLGFEVKLIQEWLVEKLPSCHPREVDNIYLLSHCTEKTACVAAEKQWQDIFLKLGLNLIPLSAGCCGMAGSYGHELEHIENSKALFEMDWQRYLKETPEAEKVVLATGYSCRSQAKRLTGIKLQHPIELLLNHLNRQF